MNPQNIRVFLAIAEHRSLSTAANMLYLSQSAVSRSLDQLEKELGAPLVLRGRGSRQVKLTPAGETFLPLAKQQQEADARIQQFARSLKEKSFRLAANATAQHYLIPDIAQNLMRKSSHLNLHLLPCNNSRIPQNVEAGLYDAGFYTGDNSAPANVIVRPFYKSEICALCPASTALPDRLISPHELDPRLEVVHTKFYKRSLAEGWRARFFSAEHSPQTECSTFLSLDLHLTDPRHWALIPLAQARYFVSRNPGQLVIRQFKEIPSYQSCSIVISPSYADTAVLDSFMQSCHEYLDTRPYLINCLPQNAPGKL